MSMAWSSYCSSTHIYIYFYVYMHFSCTYVGHTTCTHTHTTIHHIHTCSHLACSYVDTVPITLYLCCNKNHTAWKQRTQIIPMYGVSFLIGINLQVYFHFTCGFPLISFKAYLFENISVNLFSILEVAANVHVFLFDTL